VALSPRESKLAADLGVTYWLVRRPAEAEMGLRRALALDPDNVYAEINLSKLRVYRHGDFSGAWAVLRGDRPEIALERVELLRLQRKYAEALRLLAPIPEEAVSYDDAKLKALLAATLHLAAGEPAQAQPLLRQAKVQLQTQLGTLPDNYGNGQSERMALADTEALLGDEAAALATTQQALTQLPVEKDAYAGAITLAQAVKVYARLGRADLVMPILERLRRLPGADESISASTLSLDPVWDKVRDDPRFQAEIKRFAEFDQP